MAKIKNAESLRMNSIRWDGLDEKQRNEATKAAREARWKDKTPEERKKVGRMLLKARKRAASLRS